MSGMVPIPEIQYLAYLHNAEDQLRGEAGEPVVLLERPVPQPAGGPDRRLRLPEGVRWPLPQRQLGRGAARHPWTRKIASPAHLSDAAPMLHLCVAAVLADGTVSAFLEPIACTTRDLHDDGDDV
ncbi:MAG: hypothetical protein R2697_02000 [Ilumatobacteraceae bacterium]